MKINNPLSVLRSIHERLSIISMAFDSIKQGQDDGCPYSSERMYRFWNFLEDTTTLAEICLKLSDPGFAENTLTDNDLAFLNKLYLESNTAITKDDILDEFLDDHTKEN